MDVPGLDENLNSCDEKKFFLISSPTKKEKEILELILFDEVLNGKKYEKDSILWPECN